MHSHIQVIVMPFSPLAMRWSSSWCSPSPLAFLITWCYFRASAHQTEGRHVFPTSLTFNTDDGFSADSAMVTDEICIWYQYPYTYRQYSYQMLGHVWSMNRGNALLHHKGVCNGLVWSAMVWSASLDILFVSVVPLMFSFETFIASDVFSVTELGCRIGRQRYTEMVERQSVK